VQLRNCGSTPKGIAHDIPSAIVADWDEAHIDRLSWLYHSSPISE
jgi:hypothetical protein